MVNGFDPQRHFANPELIKYAWDMTAAPEKRAFVPDQQVQALGAPDGGAPPAPPNQSMPVNPGGGLDAGTVRQIVTEVLGQHGHPAGAGGPGGAQNPSGAAIKPKIDQNVELMQIKNMLAKVIDALGLHVPTQDLVATPEKLQAMANGQPTGSDAQPQQAGGAQPISPIQPLGPLGAGGGGHAHHAHKAAYEQGTDYAVAPANPAPSPSSQLWALLGRRGA